MQCSSQKKVKRILAATLAVLMVNPITGYGVSAHAQEAQTITAFSELSGKIASQQLAVGAVESDIQLPDTLNVTISISSTDTTESTVEESQPDESTVEEPAVGITSGEDSTVSENDAEEPQDETNDTKDNTATDSQATPVVDSGKMLFIHSVTGSAISADADQTDTEEKDTEEITSKERTLTGITWQINAVRSGSDTFDSTNAGEVFFYEPVLPEGYTLGDGVGLPQIIVTVGGMMARATGTMLLESGEGWSFDPATGKLTITSNNGAANWLDEISDRDLVSSCELKSTVTTMTQFSFYGCINLLSVTIPESVTRIESNAFELCSLLEKITFLGNTPPSWLGDDIFRYVPKLTVKVPTGTVSAYTTAFGSRFPDGSEIIDRIKVTGVTLNKTKLELTSIGAEETLIATVLPEDATNKAVTWSSYDDSIAAVDDNGKVKAIAVGKTFIRVKTADGNFENRCTVSVQSVTITAQPQDVSVSYGYTTAPTLNVTAEKTTAASGGDIAYQWYILDSRGEYIDTEVGINSSSYTLPTNLNVGTYHYCCYVSCDGYEQGSAIATVTVTQSATTFDGGIKTYKEAAETTEFKYGDIITVKATPKATGTAPGTFALTPPAPNQMALFVGNTQISDPVNADISGVYTMTYDTTGKALAIGSNTITAKYVGNANMADFSADVVVSINRAILSVTAIGSHKYNGTNTFSPEFTEAFGLDGIRSNDQVTALVSISVSDANVGENKPNTVNTIELRGADKDFYSLIPETILYVVSITKRLLTSDMMVSVDDVTYNGTQHKPTQNVMDGNPSIIKPSDYTVSYGENINVGLGTVTITATESGNYYGETYQVFRISQSATTFDGGIKTYKGAEETSTFTYGDTITVKATPKATGIASGLFALTPLATNQMALFAGTTQISDPVNADGSGVYTMTYDTTGKALASGSNTITAKYVGNANMADFSADVSVTLKKKKLTVSVNGSMRYDGSNHLIPNFSKTFGLHGMLGSDDVNALAQGTVPDANVGDGKVFTATSVDMRGADKDFYSLALSDINCTVAITKRPLYYATMEIVGEFTYNGTQHKPTVTVTDGNIIKPSDYTVIYGENINAGIGLVTITATESGNYSDSIFREFTIRKATPTVNLTTAPADTTYGSPVMLFAAILGVNGEKPTGTMTFRENSNTLASNVAVTDGSASYAWENVSGGDHSVIVEYTAASDGTGKNYTDVESSTITFNVAKANQSALSIDEVTGQKYGDGEFVLSTTGGSGTGDVTYSVPANNGVLSITTGNIATIIGAGTVTVTSTKAGDNNYNSITTTREISIGKAATPTITYPAASNITYGQKLSASTLSGGSTEYGSFAWNNERVVLTAGIDKPILVIFTPNANTVKNYEPITKTTGSVAITVSKATPAMNLNAIVSGDTGSRKATLTATVTGVDDGERPTGTVKFVNSTDGSDVDIAGANSISHQYGSATFEWTGLADQIYKVKAVYSGSSNYNIATSEEISFDTSKKNQVTLSISEIGAKTYGDGNFTLLINGGSGNGVVTYGSSDSSVVSISGTTATIHKADTVTITATKAATDTYNEATVSVSLTVGKKTLSIKADDKLNIVKGAAMPDLTYTATGLVGSDTFTSPSISATAANTNTVGEYNILISGGTLANADSYAVTYIDGKLTVVNSVYTVTVTYGTGGGSYSEGQTVTITADSRDGYTFTGWSSSDSVTFANSTASTTTFTMPGKAVTVKANYSKNSSSDSSGSSSGGSSTSTTTTTPEKMPNQPVTAVAPVTATAGANGGASASIPDKAVTDAIAKAQTDAKAQGKTANGITVALDVILPKGTASLTAALTRSSLDSLVSAGVSSLEINGSIVQVSFDKKALAEIQKQSSGNINIAIAPKTNLSDAAKKLIGTRPVYDITVGYGSGKSVSSFGGGVATVSIPYTLGKNEEVGGLYAVYVDTNGNATRIAGSVYDANSGCVIFTTTHFSQYGIGYTAPAAKFTDISTHWAKESVDYVVGRGLLSATSDTAFSPSSAMTRGMLVTALGRLAGVDVKAYTTNSFTDVNADSAYRPYIEWAYSKGIIQGIGGSQFAPDRAITREEIAVIFTNYAKVTGYTLPITREVTTHADASSIGSAYKDAVNAMQQAGIMMGGSDNKFNPKGNATRAEVSSMLGRYIKLIINPATAQGWAQNDAGQYLYYKDGKALTGTQAIDGVKYFFNTDGTLKTGWVKDGDSWRFYSGKTMLVGFWDLGANGNNKTYYFTKDGLMVSGKWLEIDGKWYYFYTDGFLARSTKIDGYEVDEKGVRKAK